MSVGSALGQSRVVRDAPGVQITTGKQPTNLSKETADNQHIRQNVVTLSLSHLGQARLEPNVTHEQVAICHNASLNMLRTTGWHIRCECEKNITVETTRIRQRRRERENPAGDMSNWQSTTNLHESRNCTVSLQVSDRPVDNPQCRTRS